MPAATPESYRVLLPSGLWVREYPDGGLKIAGWDRKITVTGGPYQSDDPYPGASIFLAVELTADPPRPPTVRAADLIASLSIAPQRRPSPVPVR